MNTELRRLWACSLRCRNAQRAYYEAGKKASDKQELLIKAKHAERELDAMHARIGQLFEAVDIATHA